VFCASQLLDVSAETPREDFHKPLPRKRALLPAGRQDELRNLLDRWHPIGIYDEEMDFPPGEYDCLIGPLPTRPGRHDARASLSEHLWYEIFGLDPVRCGTDHFADRLLAWYAAKNQTP